MFPFSRKEKQDDCFFLNKRNLLERELSYSIFGEEKIRNESKPRNMIRKSFSKRRTIVKYWSNVLQSFTKIIFRSIFVWVCVLFETYLQKSFRRCQLLWKSAFVCGQILSIWLNIVNSDIHWAGLAGKAQNPCARSFVKVADRFP